MYNRDNKIPFFQIIIFLLSVYVVIMMILQFFVKFSQEMEELLWIIDTCICGIFIIDFGINFITAKHKLKFLKSGIIDLVASIPNVGALRFGRIAKIIRIFRMLKAMKSINGFLNQTFENKGEGIFKSVILFSTLLVIISSMAILHFEQNTGSINTAYDAFWWTLYTLLGMDYGEPPITTIGKVIAVLLVICGMSLLGSFTAYLADIFLTNKK